MEKEREKQRKPVGKTTAFKILTALLAGILAGAAGMCYYTVSTPERLMHKVVEKQNRALGKMVRSGEVLSVNNGRLTMKIKKSGDKRIRVDSVVAYKVLPTVTVQEGNKMLSVGEKVYVGRYVKKGDYVDVLVQGEEIIALHME